MAETLAQGTRGTSILDIFLSKIWVDKKEVEIYHCETAEMLADYFTKPLQGRIFKVYRDVIMGYKEIKKLKSIIAAIKERVEYYKNNNYCDDTIF